MTGMRLRRRRDDDRGAALLEFVLVAPLLVLLLFGTIEMGLAFRDWLTVTSASRAGARVGSAAGNNPSADVAILDSVEAAMSGADFTDVTSVWVYEVDSNGQRGLTNVYTRTAAGCGWSPCPGGVVPWDPTTRSVKLGDLDTLGVRVNFDHDWLTGVLNLPDASWADDAIMRLEPQEF